MDTIRTAPAIAFAVPTPYELGERAYRAASPREREDPPWAPYPQFDRDDAALWREGWNDLREEALCAEHDAEQDRMMYGDLYD